MSWPAKSRSSASATVRELSPFGITEASTGVHATRSDGAAMASIRTAVAAATSAGRRITARERRYQPPWSSGRSRRWRTVSLPPHTANRAGEITSDPTPATTATTAPAMPIDFRKPSGKTVRVASAIATVAEEKAMVRPAVAIVVRIAARPGPWRASSSRKRVTRKSV